MHGNRAIDDVAVHFRRADDDGKVLLLDRARLELDRQPVMGLIVPGHENRAAGVAVQSMHDARPQRPAAAAEAGAKVELQRTDKRSRPVSAGRMHDHPRRLVDDDQVLVFEEDLQGNLFRPRGLAGNFRQNDPHPLPRANAIGRLSAVLVDAHAAGRNHAPQMAPAVIVKVQGKQNVQPLAGLTFVDDELDRLVGERRVSRDICSAAHLSFFGVRLRDRLRSSGFAACFEASGFARFDGFRIRLLVASASASSSGSSRAPSASSGLRNPWPVDCPAERRRRHDGSRRRVLRQGRLPNWLAGSPPWPWGVYSARAS